MKTSHGLEGVDMIDLSNLRTRLDYEEDKRLSPYAARSTEAFREMEEERISAGHRQWFSIDADRILHSLSYTRYIDKTQVFFLIPNDHITHRVLHVQLVSKIARTIGRLLRLNEDLIEAIALGHDIGHPPFGHDGERYLSEICIEHGIPPFIHSVQGVHFLRHVERKGKGMNLSCQVLDGILCHDGERHLKSLKPLRKKDFKFLDREIAIKLSDPDVDLSPPMTLEGCVVRMADVISYIGRDIEDALRINLITKDQVPMQCRETLGETNGTIVYRLVEDLISNSLEKDEIAFSQEMADALFMLKEFNYEFIYKNPKIKTESDKIKWLYRILFDRFLNDLNLNRKESVIFKDYLDGMDPSYREAFSPPEIVRDFIAGMTDAYFLRMGKDILIPRPFPARF
ncbi:MAG: deoxyguanosinetriphosphate triphosphohydrolase family protein [Dissulfurimicrobium sp.]|uniref:deoxyguanosinetriphosphate triphosphohydrolase family protein n=1 Tax=Dissulfurimicrobium TaxID=1769732 RepID=UPI001EDB7D3B|nr:HD domain-containing protein [Dissulfurimicrobium hydrothermale]UKL13044.1 HD domain-containing protein [Dissulfurimicrobium hydrothermale]